MYDLALSLLFTDPLAADRGGLGSASVQVAIIGGLFGLITLTLSIVLDKSAQRRRGHADPLPPAPDDDDEYHAELLRRATNAEDERDRLRAELREKRHDLINANLLIASLREFVIVLGYNPDTRRKLRPRPERDETPT